MYGRYSRQLGEFAKLEALRQQEKRRIKEEKARKKELRGYQGIGHPQHVNKFWLCQPVICCRKVVEDFFVSMEAHVRETGGGLGVSGTVGRDNGCS